MTKKLRWYLLALAASSGLSTIAQAGEASFDCIKATTSIEKMICADQELSSLDKELNNIYRNLTGAAAYPDIKKSQRAWLRQRNLCAETECLKNMYRYRAAELSEKFSNSEEWPKIDRLNQSACKDAFQMASDTFKSNSMYLFSDLKFENVSSIRMVLGANNLDISGGDSLVFESAAFDKIPNSDAPAVRSTYWQLKPKYKNRLVVKEANAGWRGDMYSLYIVSEDIKSEEFLADTNGDHRKFVPVISDSWRPPMIFWNANLDQYWFVDVGQPFQFLSDWSVYADGQFGVRPICTIQFHPSVTKAIDLLPTAVGELERLLDETMGSGSDEGTLQPTARLRVEVEHIWANAAMRPWVVGDAYNTRDEVDVALEGWSEKGSSYRRIYLKIRNQYPVAERALSLYYQQRFGKSEDEAKRLSASVLDVAFRAHYTFSRL